MSAGEYLLVGLGNPGDKYHDTRHNIGFMLIDELARRWNATSFNEKYTSLFAKARVSGSSVALMQPQTFMNLSGKSVAEYVNFFKTPLDQVIIVHDDIDMAPGRIKLVKGGGAGGHNGIKSINACLGKTDYYRLKIGVGRPGKFGVHPDIPVDRYVLSAFSQEQAGILAERFCDLVDGLEVFFEDSPQAAATRLNSLK